MKNMKRLKVNIMKEPIFTGSAVAIITPFNEDFSINYEAFKEIIDYQAIRQDVANILQSISAQSV